MVTQKLQKLHNTKLSDDNSSQSGSKVCIDMTASYGQVTQKLQNSYTCKLCDYNTSRKSSFDKHMLTAKHGKVTFGDAKVAKSCNQYICTYCSKTYQSRNGLWRHKKTCTKNDSHEITHLICCAI